MQQHILDEQRRFHPNASGEFSWLLSGITLATKIVAAQVRRAGLASVLGATGDQNVQGEVVQKLDLIANQALLSCLGSRGNVAIMASEENEEPVVVDRDRADGKYVVIFDPLDGSSNIDVNVSVGTISSILERPPDPTGARDPLQDVLQAGHRQLAAGYVVYGSSTMLVYTSGHGVFSCLDPAIGGYVLSHERLLSAAARSIIRSTEANADAFRALPPLPWPTCARAAATPIPRGTRRLLVRADFHRTLLKGGIFLSTRRRNPPQRQTPASCTNPTHRLPRRTSRRSGRQRPHPHPRRANCRPAPAAVPHRQSAEMELLMNAGSIKAATTGREQARSYQKQRTFHL